MDMLRASVRPVLSYAAAGGLAWTVRHLLTIVPLAVLLKENPQVFWGVYEYVINGTAFVAFASISYWYGTRPMKMK